MDYRFIIGCVQEQAGDEDAKLNVYHGDTKLVDQAVISSTDASDPDNFSWVTFEITGLDAPGDSTTVDIKLELANDYYVDTNTDRDIKICFFGYTNKADNTSYKSADLDVDERLTGYTAITDFSDYSKYIWTNPTAVTGDNLENYWDDAIAAGQQYTVPVFGGVLGTTVTLSMPFGADVRGGTY